MWKSHDYVSRPINETKIFIVYNSVYFCVLNESIAFLIVRFVKLNKTFLLTIEKLSEFLTNSTKKSIPIDYFLKNGYSIEEKYNPRLDYLSIIEKIYFKGELKWNKRKILKM